MEDRTILSLWTATLVAGLMSWALYLGHNGTLLLVSVGAIAGLGGYEVGRRIRKPPASPTLPSSRDLTTTRA
jgi:hypothetical protein